MSKQAAVFAGVLMTCMLAPSYASAQQTAPAPASAGPASFALLGGLMSGGGSTGGSIGGTFAVDLTRTYTIEGRGIYSGRGMGADTLDVDASLLVHLLTSRKASPYLAIGGGIHRASFDLDNQRFFGMMGLGAYPGAQLVPISGTSGWGFMPGPGMMGWPASTNWGPGWMMANFNWNGAAWNGPTVDLRQMPMFYAGRLGAMTVPMNGRWGRRSFTDPAISLGGGVRLDLTNKVYVTPDARALVIIGNGDTYTIASVSFGLGYRF